jgi:hypothetical protein
MTPDENSLLSAVGLDDTGILDFSIPLPLRKKSTCIASANYNIFTQTLTIAFQHGDVLQYHAAIPIALGLIAAESPGGFYNSYIRGQAEI